MKQRTRSLAPSFFETFHAGGPSACSLYCSKQIPASFLRKINRHGVLLVATPDDRHQGMSVPSLNSAVSFTMPGSCGLLVQLNVKQSLLLQSWHPFARYRRQRSCNSCSSLVVPSRRHSVYDQFYIFPARAERQAGQQERVVIT
jgi:hypothetical protein